MNPKTLNQLAGWLPACLPCCLAALLPGSLRYYCFIIPRLYAWLPDWLEGCLCFCWFVPAFSHTTLKPIWVVGSLIIFPISYKVYRTSYSVLQNAIEAVTSLSKTKTNYWIHTRNLWKTYRTCISICRYLTWCTAHAVA